MPALETPIAPATAPAPQRVDGGGGAGDGHGNGDGDGHGDGSGGSGPPIRPEKIGVLVLCVSLSMLFVGFLGAYLVIRKSAGANWPPRGFPPLPSGLWWSTVTIVASSVALIAADRAGRLGDLAGVRRWLGATAFLGGLFCLLQAWLWGESVRAGLDMASSLYGAMFFALTGLHALHVLGGIAVLVHAWVRACFATRAAPLRGRIELTGLYWHFVGLLWLVLFGVLCLAG